ncbi:chloride channel CLIC-like protein 1 [Poeciliopsis prolifica]|uniref:chloride channel CLIC-like protein 1 n=1 Tax=Poeciliopsis prolifica TaxID=188132 RepID=UPI002413A15E|nr:chloride channel CLIC-like protein 1 [Poeciliopsis prolifica]
MWSFSEIMVRPKLRCDLVLKSFLGRLMKEIYRAGEPTDFNDFYYNAKIKLSKQTINELEMFMNGEDNWRPEALDDALSGILVELKPHNVFTSVEYMFGLDLVPMLTIGFFSIIGVLIALIKPQLRVSWLKCFITTFAISFFVSIPWNWFYLYKEAYAKHQSKLMKVEIHYQECMRLQNLCWFGSLREWFRTTLTFQSDPCEEYLKIFLIDPFLEVPPIKPFVYTLTTFIIEPLRALGEGLGGFFQALLNDLPFIVWIPVILCVTICSLGALMGGLPTVFHQQVRRFLPWLDRNQGRNVNAQAPNQLQNDNVRHMR